jgi:hypothetical protein
MTLIQDFSRAVVVAASLQLLPATAVAYDKAGHFHAMADVLAHALPDQPDVVKVISLCVQLPDEASELDATEQAWLAFKGSPGGYANWGFRDRYDDPQIQQMILVQRLQHVLNGSPDTQAVQNAAAGTAFRLASHAADVLRGRQPPEPAAELNADLCAVGLALHAYGDSFAHVTMDDGGPSSRRMYPTGTGHAPHLHYPDYPLCETFNGFFALWHHCAVSATGNDYRARNWQTYWATVTDIISRSFNSHAAPVATAADPRMIWNAKYRDCEDDDDLWCENTLRRDEDIDSNAAEPAADTVLLAGWLDGHKLAPCNSVLSSAWSLPRPGVAGAVMPGSPPDCAAIWQRYRDTAQKNLAGTAPDIRLDSFPSPAFSKP